MQGGVQRQAGCPGPPSSQSSTVWNNSRLFCSSETAAYWGHTGTATSPVRLCEGATCLGQSYKVSSSATAVVISRHLIGTRAQQRAWEGSARSPFAWLGSQSLVPNHTCLKLKFSAERAELDSGAGMHQISQALAHCICYRRLLCMAGCSVCMLHAH